MSTERIMQQIIELKKAIEEDDFWFDEEYILAEDHLLELINELQEELVELDVKILDCEDRGDLLLQEFLFAERRKAEELLSNLR